MSKIDTAAILKQIAETDDMTDSFTVTNIHRDRTVLETKSRAGVIEWLLDPNMHDKGLSNFRVTEWENDHCPECGSMYGYGAAILSQTTADEWLEDQHEELSADGLV